MAGLETQMNPVPPAVRARVIAVFSYRYDAHLVPDLIGNISGAVHGWAAFDDRGAAGPLGDEPARRNLLLAAARDDAGYAPVRPRIHMTAYCAETEEEAERNAKLIYIMRNPIDRCESHIAHNIGHGRITRESFDIRHPILTSLYASQLDIYRKYFSSDQLLLLSIDDLENNPEHAMRSIGEFLDLGWEQLRVGKPRKVRTLQGELLSDAHKREIANAVCPDMRRLVDEYGFPGAKPWIASLERWMD